jgi:hypothetical protein
VREPDRLVGAFTSDYSGPAFGSSSFADVADFNTQGSDVFTGVTGFSLRPAAVGNDDNLERIAAEIVTDNYFQVLGTTPIAGRGFGAEQRVPGGPPVAVISYSLWQRRFGGDPSIVGKPLRMNAREFTILGVAPKGFAGSVRGLAVDVWVPASIGAYVGSGRRRSPRAAIAARSCTRASSPASRSSRRKPAWPSSRVSSGRRFPRVGRT